jgi:uncharacterized repeat protein (TIGR03803 family)
MKHFVYAFLLLWLGAVSLAQPSGKLLYSFGKEKGQGIGPDSGLISDVNGNFYGVAHNTRGNGLWGTVFELSPSLGGGWTETTLYTFSFYEGAFPVGNLVFDSSGNLYGATSNGGQANDTGCSFRLGGCGTVYELSPQPDGTWVHTILHSFDHTDGAYPRGGLIFDGEGNLYGTTYYGGGPVEEDEGSVFELSPGENGWTLTTLHVFLDNSHRGDGFFPAGNLVFDAVGNLYGTTLNNYSVFELSPGMSGWTETLLPLDASAGINPTAGLVIDNSGNLYGATTTGGTDGGGSVFELSPGESGWTTTILASFSVPYTSNTAPLSFDSEGNLYGVIGQECDKKSCAAVFELSPGEVWTLIPLMGFPSDGAAGGSPNGGLLIDGSGNVYGTAQAGGAAGYGTVFEITP